MITRILDTSVACAWYLPETFSSAARYWQQQLLNEKVRLIAPSLHILEFGNVLRKYVRRGEVDVDLARVIYRTHLNAPLIWEDPPRENLLEVALKYEATTYDATYISLAVLHRSPLLTAERTTTPWVVKLGKLAEQIN